MFSRSYALFVRVLPRCLYSYECTLVRVDYRGICDLWAIRLVRTRTVCTFVLVLRQLEPLANPYHIISLLLLQYSQVCCVQLYTGQCESKSICHDCAQDSELPERAPTTVLLPPTLAQPLHVTQLQRAIQNTRVVWCLSRAGANSSCTRPNILLHNERRRVSLSHTPTLSQYCLQMLITLFSCALILRVIQ